MAPTDPAALVREADTGGSPATEPEETAPASSAEAAGWSGRLPLIALGGALLPLVVAAVRALARGWVPVGDAATIGIRARDVLGGGELPLIGPTASSSWSSGILQNHPGPLFYDVLAVPVALFGGAAGLVIGTVLIEAVAVVGIFVLARRRGGPLLALAAMAMAAVLCWAMGSAALVEPWPPNTLILPAVCFFLLAWSLMDGDLACGPWLVGVGSFLVQSNLSYGVIVPVVVGVAVVGFVLRERQARHERHEQAGGLGRFRTVALVTGLVVAVAWIQPLIEQLTGDGEGNLSRVLRGTGEGGMTLDWRAALQAVATVLALPPWWARPSVDHDFRFGVAGNPLPPLGLAVLALGAVGGLLWWCLRRARRGTDAAGATAVAGLTMAAAVLVVTLVTANQTPSTPAGTVAYQLRWLWPVAAFVWLAVVAFGLGRRRTDRTDRADRADQADRVLPAGLLAATVGFSALNLAWTNQGTSVPEASMPVARDLVRELDDADIEGPVLVDTNESMWDGYTEAVMFELQRQGIDFVIHDELGYRMLGQDRRWDGDDAVALLRISTGDWATLPSPDARVLARHLALDQGDHDELFLLQADIEEAFADGEIGLNEQGRRTAARGVFESVPDEHPDQVAADTVTDLRFLPYGRYLRDTTLMVREDLLDAPADWTRKLERYADLQERWDTLTVAVFLEPIANAERPG